MTTTPTTGSADPNDNPTESTREVAANRIAPGKPLQFDLQSLLWLTVTVSIALMYLRPFGQRSLIEATLVIAVATSIGLVVGTIRRAVGAVLYWSVLGAVFAYISTVTGRFAHETIPFAWVGVGMVTGCAVGSCAESRWLRCVAAGAVSAGLTMGVYCAFLYQFTGEFDWFELAISAPIGASMGLLVIILREVQRRSVLRYDATATLLMAAIVAGNYLSRLVAPVVSNG